jgi:hypothetical protein
MLPEHERGLKHPIHTEKPAPTPAEEARQDIVTLMQQAHPKSPQDRAISDLVSWYEVVLPHENESLDDYYQRQDEERGRIERRIDRNIARDTEYEEEHDFALVMIERYTFARSEELHTNRGLELHQTSLQWRVAEELTAMKAQARGKNNTGTFNLPEKPE